MPLASRTETDLIVVHCSATPARMDIGVEEIRKWHLQRGFIDIGYHFVIRRDGRWERGRREDAVGAHVYGKNGHSIGVCMVGGLTADGKEPEDNFTAAQWSTLEEFVGWYGDHEYQGALVAGHNELDANKACPCFSVDAWLHSIGRGDLSYGSRG